MIRALGKTVGRTRLFLWRALGWRGTQRQYAPIAWSLITGWIWLLAGLRGEPAWPEIALAALYLSAVLAAVCAIDARYGIIPASLLILRAEGHPLDRQQAISFGPHLAIGVWLSWLVEMLQPGLWSPWN